MNAALDFRRLEIVGELESIRDRLQVALQQKDYWRNKNPDEYAHWSQRVQDLYAELAIEQGKLRVVVMPGDGGPDEQRRLAAREDWKRGRDEYA